jgi:riboflavin kinase/FMN adenylyltransferase
VEVVFESDPPPPSTAIGSVVTIGAYDGVHLGHHAVIELVRREADARGLAAGLVTFDRHPARVVRPESAPKLLTSLEHKLELLAATGLLDAVWVVTFDERRRTESAEDFVLEVLVERVRARAVAVGADFHFGYQRRGNVELLERMGAEHGFDVLALPLVSRADGEVLSSTRVRGLLAAGDVAGAAAVLGRPYEVRGVHVAHRTSEVRVAVSPEFALPAPGEYAGELVGEPAPVVVAVGSLSTPLGDVLVEVRPSDGPLGRHTGAAQVRFFDRRRWPAARPTARSPRGADHQVSCPGSSSRSARAARARSLRSPTNENRIALCPTAPPPSPSTGSTRPTPARPRCRWPS